MIESVVEEVLEGRRRAPAALSEPPALALKLLAVALSALLPFLNPLAALAYAACLLALLVAVGLPRCALYAVLSGALLLASMYPISVLLRGDPSSVVRFCLTATASLASLILAVATTRPSALRRWPHLYIMSVTFGEVLREVLEVITVYRAKGLGGFRLYAAATVTVTALSLERVTALADALRARGVEVVE